MFYLQSNKRKILGTISIILIITSIIWFLSTFLPVFAIELKYQYNTFLTTQLHVSSLKELLIPNFSGLDLKGRSKYKEYGIYIPKIFIDEPVIFNVDPNDKQAYTKALKQGIAHASSTTFPNNGGLGYYFAHSSSPDFATQYNAIFYLLGKLEKGDNIYIWHDSKKNHYQVTNTQITKPSQISFLKQDYNKETIVLQTCWPPGTTRDRFLVFAQRVEE